MTYISIAFIMSDITVFVTHFSLLINVPYRTNAFDFGSIEPLAPIQPFVQWNLYPI